MTKSEVAKAGSTELATLPDLPDMFEAAPDKQSPSIYLLHGQSTAVQEGIGRPGEVILALGKDDTSPEWLIGGDEKREYFDAIPIRREVSYAIMPRGEDMEWIDKYRFEQERVEGNRDAWIVYRYVLSIPEFDSILPARLMLTKTSGRIVARALNTLIDRASLIKDEHGRKSLAQVRFNVVQKVGKQSNEKYFALNVGTTTMSADDLAVAREQQAALAMYAHNYAEENVAPQADIDQPAI